MKYWISIVVFLLCNYAYGQNVQLSIPNDIEVKVEKKSESESTPRVISEDKKGSGILDNDTVVLGFYGHPLNTYMGILGESKDLDVVKKKLDAQIAEYQAVYTAGKIKGAFHIIYATVWPQGEVGIINHKVLQRYVDYALENDIQIILDHQLGKYDVVESVRSMLPWLQYSHVNLAIDPEWSTLTPGVKIGSVTAQEINRSQEIIEKYIIDNNLNSRRMFIVHQFFYQMITNRKNVRSDFAYVDLILNADGFGTPHEKISSWNYNVLAHNIPYKGFKLFYEKSWKNIGFDSPLMQAHDVINLEPVPRYINFQ